MMGFNNSMLGGFGIISTLTWIALIVFLIAGAYYFISNAKKD